MARSAFSRAGEGNNVILKGIEEAKPRGLATVYFLPATALGLDGPFLPDAVLPLLRHQEEGEPERETAPTENKATV